MQFIAGSHQLEIAKHQSINNDPRIHGLELAPDAGVDTSNATICPLRGGRRDLSSRSHFALHGAQPFGSPAPRAHYDIRSAHKKTRGNRSGTASFSLARREAHRARRARQNRESRINCVCAKGRNTPALTRESSKNQCSQSFKQTTIAVLGVLLSSCAAKSQTPVDFGAQGTGVEEVGIAAETPNDTNNSRLAVQIGGRNGAYYGLYRFDLSSLQGSFTDIAGAKLKFHVNLKRGKWTDKKFNLYRISDANKAWSAGKSSTNKAENGAASWNYRSYSSIVDPKTGELTGTRWAGTPGLSTPTTDYRADARRFGDDQFDHRRWRGSDVRFYRRFVSQRLDQQPAR